MTNNMRLSATIILRSRILQHVVFWLFSFYVLLKVFQLSETIATIDLIYTLMFLLGISGAVYVNVLFLIPQFLAKRKYLPYCILIVMNLGFWSFFNIILFEDLIDFIFPGYYFISYYEFIDILKFTLSFIGISTLFKLSRGWFQMLEAENRIMRLESENLSSELKTLKDQLNPHFLFNSMNNIHAMAIKSADKTQALVRHLSDLLRYTLYETSEDFVPLENEVNFLKNYIELQRVRIESNVELNLIIKGELKNKTIAPLLLMPLIENAFKHGMKGDIEDTFVRVEISCESQICIIIENNNGEVSNYSIASGIGLKNVKRRLELLYPDQHIFNIHSEGKTFKVELILEK